MEEKMQEMPRDIEAEKALLGNILSEEEALFEVMESITPDMFYLKSHRQIYSTILELAQNGISIDQITVSDKLETNGLLEKIGGFEYIDELINYNSILSNTTEYIKVIIEKYKLRKIIEASNKMLKQAYSKEEKTQEILSAAEKLILGLDDDTKSDKLMTFRENLDVLMFELEETNKVKGKLAGASTGFPDLDKKISGLKGSNLLILAARPAMGKSALAVNIATNVARIEKKPVLIFNLEMSKTEIIKRILSSESRIENNKIATLSLNSDELETVAHTQDNIANYPIYISDSSDVNILEIKSKARKLKEKEGLGLIVIDYLQLITPLNKSRGSRENEISEISRGLKKIAMELNVPVLALSQLSRSVEKGESKKPGLADLRESGAIEQDADVVFFIYREGYYNPEAEGGNIAEIIIAKNRAGSTGSVELVWTGEYTRFDSYTSVNLEDVRFLD